MSDEKIAIEKRFRKFEIDADLGVRLSFDEILTFPPVVDGGESRVNVRHHTIIAEDIPHPDLLDILKKLKPHAIDINEMDHPDSKHKQDYRISMIQIDGDMVLQKSRVRFKMMKHVEATGKQIAIGPSSQISMYGSSTYGSFEAMTKLLEKFEQEFWLYIGGKFNEDPEIQPTQLPLFERIHFELV